MRTVFSFPLVVLVLGVNHLCAQESATEQAAPPSAKPVMQCAATNIRRDNLHAPTPEALPCGGKTIAARELKAMMSSAERPIVIDVLGGDIHSRKGVPGAVYMGQEAGQGRVSVESRERFRAALDKMTGFDKNRALVFYCLSVECYLSYNASLRAIYVGYTNVYWFRGGIEGWKAEGFAGEAPKQTLEW